jgi:phosphatidylinositol-3,4,5-trisphosphate 3-phosphatase/dual-specificity protein phosphatase PTEN
MHSGIVKTTDEALVYYGTRRTHDGKGVTIASQQRYIRYYEQVLQLGKVPEPRLLNMKTVRVHTIPKFDGEPYATIVVKGKTVSTSKAIKIPKGANSYDITVDAPVYGDVKVQLSMHKGRSHVRVFVHTLAVNDPRR